jgi:hypothetical protein
MQKTLYDPGAGRRLKPIKVSSDTLRSRNSDDMLDQFYASLQADFDSTLDTGGYTTRSVLNCIRATEFLRSTRTRT